MAGAIETINTPKPRIGEKRIILPWDWGVTLDHEGVIQRVGSTTHSLGRLARKLADGEVVFVMEGVELLGLECQTLVPEEWFSFVHDLGHVASDVDYISPQLYREILDSTADGQGT